ncbi:NAD(+)--rifampin ADP-ribosyltransferase [Duganella sp. FT135W]|uniref:NAD(+)--rifampin ADP-ribosyltransferase n=1 Tax=Duganella flavida TaxID=2692175 RepID=A0A6L8K8E6_9BURK|nr:NAD(+)--rifampin ADP-ribosyltransferase [Duganella flavida]MYM23305.1 NAD(+)--rifampin ADP-ribosyltransferase [Duganella flavida]
MSNPDWTPVTHESCGSVKGPFYHGTKYELETGDLLVPGFASNFDAGRISNNVYFSALMEPAIWGAELATSLAGAEGRGYIYIVEATGSFEDDPNLTNKRFAGNPTQSYRTRHPLKIVGKVEDWQGHPPEVLQLMLDSLKEKMRNGLAAIED